MATFQTIDIRHEGAVAVVTLNRPEAMNAADAVMHRELSQVWDYLADDLDTRVVVLTGAVNTGGTASNLNSSKIREARKTLMGAEVDLDTDMIFMPVTASQHDALLNEITIISSDFNGGERPVLQEGKVTRWLGVNIPHTERLTTGTADDSSTSRQVPMYAQSGMYLGDWDGTIHDLTQRKDLQGLPYQIYDCMTFGATRLEERKMVRIWCKE